MNIKIILKILYRTILIFVSLFFFLYGFISFVLDNTICEIEYNSGFVDNVNLRVFEYENNLDRYSFGLYARYDSVVFENINSKVCVFGLRELMKK